MRRGPSFDPGHNVPISVFHVFLHCLKVHVGTCKIHLYIPFYVGPLLLQKLQQVAGLLVRHRRSSEACARCLSETDRPRLHHRGRGLQPSRHQVAVGDPIQ
jgi:hypothetical protein|eukprot:COSAG01_NODE_1252_length_11052_cov_503.195380_4_plen_101_part_00